jgi:hypothetical protein
MQFVRRGNKTIRVADPWKNNNPSVLCKSACHLHTQGGGSPRDTPQQLQCCLRREELVPNQEELRASSLDS